MFILKPLNDAWLDPKSSMKVQEAIQIMYGLVVCRFDVSSFLPFFGAIFSARCTLETHVSHYKSYLDEIITEITSKTKHSHHLLDDALFVNQNIPTYQTTEDEENILIIATATEEAVNVKHVDNVVQVSLRYLANFKASLKVDFFLMLLEHLSYTHLYTSKQNLILYSLIDSVNETVCDNIVEYPEKCISFVVTVLERSANEISKSSFSLNESPSSENEVLSTLNEDTKLVALQIVSVLLNEKDKLTTQHVQSLKQCIRSLNLLIANESDTTEKSRLMSICDQLISMENPKYSVKSASRFHQAMKDLNDAIMPTRAHALVELKRLIFAKDAETLAHQNDLVALLTVCLSDSESYIYLSAINTLAALATVNVHDILPLLANAFLSDNRTVQERVNVAEVIVQLSKRLGEMAPHYADDFINCLMAGLTSHEATIRISSLSCLGQFCALLKFSLRKYIIQVMGAVTSLLKTDSVLEVKRACLMWIHLVLNGLDKTSLEALGPELITMYRIVKHNYEHCLDDVMRLHSQLALEQLDQLAKEMLSPDIPMRKKIEILS
ncbi:Transport and Golgi organization protein 6 -like protein [Halotydeus destructor]|nr:Transport and Golgi organization protein 6 -like protein [Halotydeus destructor]